MIDSMFYKIKYDPDNYNCAHFVVKLWEHLTNQNISYFFSGVLISERERKAEKKMFENVIEINKAESPCIVLFKNKFKETHVGVFFKNKVLHLTSAGTKCEPLHNFKMVYESIRFFKC